MRGCRRCRSSRSRSRKWRRRRRRGLPGLMSMPKMPRAASTILAMLMPLMAFAWLVFTVLLNRCGQCDGDQYSGELLSRVIGDHRWRAFVDKRQQTARGSTDAGSVVRRASRDSRHRTSADALDGSRVMFRGRRRRSGGCSSRRPAPNPASGVVMTLALPGRRLKKSQSRCPSGVRHHTHGLLSAPRHRRYAARPSFIVRALAR